MSLTAHERETTINLSDGDDVVRIWTAQLPVIRRFRANQHATEIKTGFHEGSEWSEFTIPADKWFPWSGFKRTVNMTEERKLAQAEQLAAMRAARASRGTPPTG